MFGHFEREAGDEESRSDLVVGQRVQLQDILNDGPSWVRGLTPPSTQTRDDNVRTACCSGELSCPMLVRRLRCPLRGDNLLNVFS